MEDVAMTTAKGFSDADILAALKCHFHHDSFRKGQIEAVRETLSGRDVLVVMPTGSGKSLCYQLPALMLDGTTIVVSPLIALMKDQTDALEALGIPATFINSAIHPGEAELRMGGLAAGAYKLVYVAPERFRNERFLTFLDRSRISLLAIDEAHCISSWGHDFRPDYLNLRNIAARLGGVRIQAVTATATPDVRRDIIKQLGLGEGARRPPSTHVHGFARDNLVISVTRCRTHDDKQARVLAAVRECGPGIVYAATRKQAERIRDRLALSMEFNFASRDGSRHPDLILYHGALTDRERLEAQNRFVSSPWPVVVATNAFGMGVDRSDLRFVVHWDVPGSIEAYYQEIGRAGRDGGKSRCELLFNYADVQTQQFFIDNLYEEAEVSNGIEAEAARRLKEAKLEAMLRFVDCRSCRHRFILEYFGEDTTGFHCPGCDHCPSSDCPPLSDAQYIFVQKVLSCVARMKGRFGPKRIAQVLTGDDDPTLEERGLTALSTYGILQHTQPRLIYDVLDRLADAGCIDVSNDSYHLMAITPKGVAAAKRMLAGFTIPWPQLRV